MKQAWSCISYSRATTAIKRTGMLRWVWQLGSCLLVMLLIMALEKPTKPLCKFYETIEIQMMITSVMHTCTYALTLTCTRTHMHIYILTAHTHSHMHNKCVYMCTHIFTHIHTHTHTHTYKCTHAHAHIYMHTCMHTATYLFSLTTTRSLVSSHTSLLNNWTIL